MPRMFFLSWQPPDMCGIAGTFNFTPTQPIDRERLVTMTDVIAHRESQIEKGGPRDARANRLQKS